MTVKKQETKTPAAKTKAAKTTGKKAGFNETNKDLKEFSSDGFEDNAENGADGLRFNENDYFNYGSLPCIENENAAVSDLADVFAASGLFGDLSPAQIAVQILAGRELGFMPVAAMYNLELKENFSIAFRGDPSAPPFLTLADRIGFARTVETKSDKTTGGGFCEVCGGLQTFFAVVKNEGEKEFPVCSLSCQNKAQTNPAIKTDADAECCPVCGETDITLSSVAYKVKGDKESGIIDLCSAACSAEYRRQRDEQENANAGDLSALNSENDVTPAPNPELSTADGGDGAADAKTTKAETETEQIAAARKELNRFCFEMASIGLDINELEKLEKFDNMRTFDEKKKYFRTVHDFYISKRTVFETEIAGCFIANNWTKNEQKVYIDGRGFGKDNLPECSLLEIKLIFDEMKKDKLI